MGAEKRISLISDGDCSVNSTKVEIDSISHDDEDFSPLMIQDFKDSGSDRLNTNFLESDLDVTEPRSERETRLRSSTRKGEQGLGETGNSLLGSSRDISSDESFMSDSENIANLRNSLHAKVRFYIVIF